MKNAINTLKSDFRMPDENQIREAVKMCCGRCCSACESPVEYALRQERLSLADIVDRAVDRELDEEEKQIIKDIYFDNLSPSECAERRGIPRSTVYTREISAKRKLKKSLEYLMLWLGGSPGERGEEAAAVLAAGRADRGGIASRISCARLKRGIPLATAEKASEIGRERLVRIEKGRARPYADEIVRLCRAYGAPFGEILGEE